MIIKMKKYSFLIYHKDYHPFLNDLRELGVMHVVEKQSGVVEENSNLYQCINTGKRFSAMIKALNTIKEHEKMDDLLPEDKTADGISLLEKAEQLYADRDQALQRKEPIIKELERIKPWGNFELERFHELERAHIYIHFHTTSESKFEKEWINEYNAVKIKQQGSTIYFITITKEPTHPHINAEHIKSFDNSASELKTALSVVDKEISQIDESLKMMVKNDLNTLIAKERETRDQINWEKVALSSDAVAEEKLMLLEGFVPEEKEPETTNALQNKSIYFEVTTPTPKEKIPILLRNNKFAKLFEPIGELYDLPKYHALDLTPFFAPFFMLFFGVCLGDTGYGLLILIATLIARSKVKPSLKPILSLASVLGAATVIMGFVSGTFFGISLLKTEWAWLTSFKQFMLDSDQLFSAALYIGAVQLLYAMIVRAYFTARRLGWAYSLERWGWVVLFAGLGTLYLIHGNELFDNAPIYLIYAIVGVAGLLILVLNHPKRNPLINIGAGLWSTFNMATGIIGDFLSYIRLFALGLCGSVMGLVFNQLAVEIKPDIPVLGHLLMIFILIFGHSLNIFMSCLGSFVHPMRLTFVEFYKNAGFEGGGKKYKPFRYIQSEP